MTLLLNVGTGVGPTVGHDINEGLPGRQLTGAKVSSTATYLTLSPQSVAGPGYSNTDPVESKKWRSPDMQEFIYMHLIVRMH